MYARFLSHLLLVYIGRVHGAISGCTVLLEVHPASAQTKSLISYTDLHPAVEMCLPNSSCNLNFEHLIYLCILN